MRFFTAIALLLLSLTGCYKETDVAPDLYTSAGEVPQIAVFWAGPTRPTTNPLVDAGTAVPVVIEYTSAIDIKEIRFYTRPNATGTLTPLTTLQPSAATYDAALRNFVVRSSVTAPTARNSSIQVVTEVVGVNNLPSAQRVVTIRTRA